MEDDFAPRYVLTLKGINSWTERVTIAPGMKRRGPTTLPCATPDVTLNKEEERLSTTTH